MISLHFYYIVISKNFEKEFWTWLRTWFYKKYCGIKKKFTRTVMQHELIFDVFNLHCVEKILWKNEKKSLLFFSIGSAFCKIDNKLIQNHTFFYQSIKNVKCKIKNVFMTNMIRIIKTLFHWMQNFCPTNNEYLF